MYILETFGDLSKHLLKSLARSRKKISQFFDLTRTEGIGPGRDSSREMRILSHADGTVMGWNGMKGNENESRNELARISRDGPYQ